MKNDGFSAFGAGYPKVQTPKIGLPITPRPFSTGLPPSLFAIFTCDNISKNVVEQLLKRNKELPPTKIVEITNLVGCSAVKK